MDDMDRLEDRWEIADLVSAYAEGVDDGRSADVAALFAEDCVFRAYRGERGTAEGRPAVEALLQKLLGTFEATSHHVSNTRVTFSGEDRADVVTALHAWHRFPSERPDGILWGRYRDTVVREGGVWRFAVRELRVAGEQDFPFGWISTREP
ncbi:hypothetical protein ASD11_16960 [Aeromicrobium sp. Root495]|nr:hypothetical protein ASD11_16960 [Aeromicrobium sp. Root495]